MYAEIDLSSFFVFGVAFKVFVECMYGSRFCFLDFLLAGSKEC